ncbi:hypothetical protein HPB52_006560 [Rhipicephalus sanguineus]|uniref:Uncharacterized protein n=1 Tax=Rhipicephalus sanguineus TaxID=34632 RepID=A0A9D4SRU3_RHISA|nr:hypothetical protein HPB52_006560 [Rhipicephalus sanguineus]
MFAKEVSVAVMALCVVKLVTSGDEVVLPSSSSGLNITGNMRSMDEDQVMSLHELLKRKLERTRGLVSLGMDPFQAGSMGFLIQEPGAYINVSLTKLAVTGLSNFTIRDVATNNAAMRASVLMIMPRVEIRCAYRVKGYISGEGEKQSRVIDESGQFEAVLGRAAMSWFARVLHVDKDDLLVAQTGLRTHVDEVVAKRIVDHVRQMVEDKLNKVITKAVSTKPSEVQDLLESLVVPTPHSEVPRTFSPHGHRISKRQVPCNNGTELDDYVDYLFRFATRLIRAMEPIQGPNFTIYIEEHLQVFLYDVQARNVYTLSRRKPAYVICKNGDVTVGLVILLDSIMATAKYRVLTDHRHLLYNGDADIKLSGTVVWIQISQLANGNNRLDVVRIWRMGKAQVLLKGLGNLTSAISMLLTSILNHDPWNVIPVAEAQAITFGREMLANITVPIFSLV